MNHKEFAAALYHELERVVDAGEVQTVWGDELILEFEVLFLERLYPEQKEEPEWVFMFIQLAHWAFSSYHEGVYTYYDNFYESDTDHGIRRLSECLYRYGFIELAKWYDYGIYDYNLYPEFDYPIEIGLRMAEVDNWIHDNPEVIWQVFVKLLQNHKEEVLEAAANETPDCEEETQTTQEKDSTPAPKVQQKKESIFMDAVDLIADDSRMDRKNTQRDGRISHLTVSQIDEKMVSLMAQAEELKWIRTKDVFPENALKILDSVLFSVRNDIWFRIYNYDREDCDLQHFAEMDHVRKLELDCTGEIRHAEVLSRYVLLTDLEMTAPKQRDFRFVNRLSQELTTLSLYADFSLDGISFEDASDGDRSGNPSYELEWLIRYPKLQHCNIGNYAKHMEFMIRKDDIKELILCEMPCPPIDVLRMLKVQSVIVHAEHAQKLERLGQIASIQELELVKITDIDNLDFLETLPSLQKLTLRSLPALTRLPHFPEGRKLRELAVYDCDRLLERTDLTRVSERVLIRKYT